MAKRKIVWTLTAAKQRREVLKYWTERNKSTAYAEKLIEITSNHLKVISKNPEGFKETDFDEVRESAMSHFSLYYKITSSEIIVMAFWDNRQDPKKLSKAIQGDKP
jgi:plasmid stabilization system protein ParE